MTSDHVKAYQDNKIPRPIEELNKAVSDTRGAREKIPTNGAVVHWFRWDLRLNDNTALYKASEAAKAAGKPLICLYVFSHEDFEAHFTSPAKLDFALRTLSVLKKDLDSLEIPLWVEEVQVRKGFVDHVLDLCKSWNVSKLFANIEYEVDELRRDSRLVRKGVEKGIAVFPCHDTCVVQPGSLQSVRW
jgi:deoxyribodipyrimidine photo-lyase